MRPAHGTSNPIEYIKSNMTMLIETRVPFGMDRIETDSREFLQIAVRDCDMVEELNDHYEFFENGNFCVSIYVKPHDSSKFKELKWTVIPNPVKFEEITH